MLQMRSIKQTIVPHEEKKTLELHFAKCLLPLTNTLTVGLKTLQEVTAL